VVAGTGGTNRMNRDAGGLPTSREVRADECLGLITPLSIEIVDSRSFKSVKYWSFLSPASLASEALGVSQP
jgi:hypothetical protein